MNQSQGAGSLWGVTEAVDAPSFEVVTSGQLRVIAARAAELYRWYRRHQRLHAWIGVAVLFFLGVADYIALLRFPHWLLSNRAGNPAGLGMVILAAALAGSLHSWLVYSLAAYTLHDGAAHHLIFPGKSRWQRFGHAIACNLARLGGGDPDYFAARHQSHHAHFATDDDAEFVSYVPRSRYLTILVPLASVFNFDAFLFHRPNRFTRSGALSVGMSVGYHLAFGTLMVTRFGWTFTLFAILLFFPHVGFYIDRTRHFLEHNLMPAENKDGSRSLGLGFWGILIGGGPWGQPCHGAHHLAPALPWYQQLILHRTMVRVMTPRQKQQFLIRPVVGFPLLWWDIFKRTGEPASPAAPQVQRGGTLPIRPDQDAGPPATYGTLSRAAQHST